MVRKVLLLSVCGLVFNVAVPGRRPAGSFLTPSFVSGAATAGWSRADQRVPTPARHRGVPLYRHLHRGRYQVRCRLLTGATTVNAPRSNYSHADEIAPVSGCNRAPASGQAHGPVLQIMECR